MATLGIFRLLTALDSAWLIGSILTLGVPLSMVIERHFSLRIKLTGWDAGPRCAPGTPPPSSEPIVS